MNIKVSPTTTLPRCIAALLRCLVIMSATSCFTLANAASLTMNGMSKYSELRRDFYIGALFLETTAKTEQQILNSNQAMRMVIRVSNKRWSPRSFEQHWTQSILINNDEDVLSQFADSILAFTALTKEPLTTGDEVIIDSPRDGTTSISIDSVKLMSVDDPTGKFFKLLLNAWLGPRPPSSDFKRHILGQANSNPAATDDNADQLFKAQFDRLLPAPGREAVMALWLSSDTDTLAENDAKDIKATKPAAKPVKKVATSVVAKKPTNKTKVTPKKASPTSKPKPKVAARKKIAAVPIGKVSTPSASTTPVAIRRATPDEIKKKQQETDNELVEKLSNGLKLLYRSNVMKRVYAKVSYPSRAAKRKQEGRANVLLHIARDGTLIDASLQESSGFDMLDRAAIKAARKAEPFPAVPAKIVGESVSIDVPIRFKLPD